MMRSLQLAACSEMRDASSFGVRHFAACTLLLDSAGVACGSNKKPLVGFLFLPIQAELVKFAPDLSRSLARSPDSPTERPEVGARTLLGSARLALGSTRTRIALDSQLFRGSVGCVRRALRVDSGRVSPGPPPRVAVH